MATLLRMTLAGSALTLLVLLLRALLGRRMDARALYALWLPVLLCFLLPLRLPVAAPDAAPAPLQRAEAAAAQFAASPVQLPQAEEAAAIAPQAETEARPAARLSLGQALLLVYALGAAGTAVCIASANLRALLRLKRSARPVALSLEWNRRLRGARVYVSRAAASPCLVGWRRIVLTPTALQDAQRLRHVLAHEWSHRRQGDPLWALLRALALVLHWFNPLVWLAASRSREDGESACDARAIALLGEAQRAAYGRTLLALATGAPARPADLTMALHRSGLKRRIRRIARGKQRFAALCAGVALLLALSGCAALALQPAEGQRPMASPAPTASPTDAASLPETVRALQAELETAGGPWADAEAALPELAQAFDLYGRESARASYVLALPRQGGELLVRAEAEGFAIESGGQTWDVPQAQAAQALDGTLLLVLRDEDGALASALAMRSRPQAVREAMAAYEAAGGPYADLSQAETQALLPELAQDFHLYGRRGADGQTYALALAKPQTAVAPQPVEASEWRVQPPTGAGDVWRIEEASDGSLLRAYEIPGASRAELVAGEEGLFYLQLTVAAFTAPHVEIQRLDGTYTENLTAAEQAALAPLLKGLSPQAVPGATFWEAFGPRVLDRVVADGRAYEPGRGDCVLVTDGENALRYVEDAALAQALRDVLIAHRGADLYAFDLAAWLRPGLRSATLAFPRDPARADATLTRQTRTDEAGLSSLSALLAGAEWQSGAPGCPFAARLELCRADGETLTLHLASDSCAVFALDGGLYGGYGGQEALFALFPQCRPAV